MTIEVDDQTALSPGHVCSSGPKCDVHRVDRTMETLALLSPEERNQLVRASLLELIESVRLLYEANALLQLYQISMLTLAKRNDVVVRDSDISDGILRHYRDDAAKTTTFTYEAISPDLRQSIQDETSKQQLDEDLKASDKPAASKRRPS